MIFRQNALKNLNSQEELDKSIVIAPVRLWVAIVIGILLFVTLLVWSFTTEIPRILNADGLLFTRLGVSTIIAPEDGIISESYISDKTEVHKGDVLYTVLKKDGSTVDIKSYEDEYIDKVFVRRGSRIEIGDLIADTRGVEHKGVANVIIEVPLSVSKTLETGMEVRISPKHIDANEYGYIEGEIAYIENGFAETSEWMETLLGKQFSEYIEEGYHSLIYCYPKTDDTSVNGYKWSKDEGKKLTNVTDQSPVDVAIILGYYSPAEALLSFSK